MATRPKYPVSYHVKRVCLSLTVILFLLPAGASAEPSLFFSIVEEIESLDLQALKDLKLSAKLKTGEKGKIVFQCLNFSMPVADDPFESTGSWIKLDQIEVKARKGGIVARVEFSF